MPLPEKEVRYYMQSALDRAIEQYGNNPNPSQESFLSAELNYIATLADVQAGLELYREQAKGMTMEELRAEGHLSNRLGEHLRAAGKPKPDDRVDAHAIVAGAHKDAAMLRAVMARLKIRVDDPDNGCWLPRRSRDCPHWAFPKAVPHSRIHRSNYFLWIRNILLTMNDASRFRVRLNNIGQQLQEGTLPKEVMLPKGQGTDAL